MECFSCAGTEGVILTGCSCIDLYAHPKCIEDFNNVSNRTMEKRTECSVCKRQFGLEMCNAIREIRQSYVEEEEGAEPIRPIKKYDTCGWTIVCLMILSVLFIIFTLFYLSVRNSYSIPLEIKNNQKLMMCNVTELTYSKISHKNYKVVDAYLDDGRNVIDLFNDYTCQDCPETLSVSCWNHKNYFALNKHDIEKRFDSRDYLLIIIIPYYMVICICNIALKEWKRRNTRIVRVLLIWNLLYIIVILLFDAIIPLIVTINLKPMECLGKNIIYDKIEMNPDIYEVISVEPSAILPAFENYSCEFCNSTATVECWNYDSYYSSEKRIKIGVNGFDEFRIIICMLNIAVLLMH
jgi:hypothetical protein